jgi:hypothetical protein
MNRKIIIFICMIQSLFLYSKDLKLGLGMSSDGLLVSLGVDIFEDTLLSFEGGISWEYEVDMRLDDVKTHTVLRYTIPLFKSINPYLLGGFQYSYINTGYTTFWVPGIDLGLGVLLHTGLKNEFYIECGWQYVSKKINSNYSMESYEIYYEETWKAPPLYLGFGWRISPWKNR